MITKNLTKRLYTSLVLFVLIFLIFINIYIFTFSLIVLSLLSLIEFLDMLKKSRISKPKFFINFILFLFYIWIFSFVCFAFYIHFQTKILIFSLLLCCVASDIGGFIFGKIIKGPKLTKISPNKTISGAIGSLILSCLILFLIFYYLNSNINFTILIIGIITSVGCQLGDLFFSYYKRKAKVKDTGNFFPGHGGVLDRLDGIFLGIPFGLVSTLYLY